MPNTHGHRPVLNGVLNAGSGSCHHVYAIVRRPDGHPILTCLNCPREVW